MIAINCMADIENVEGTIKIKESFKKMPPLDKADLLKDWTAQMDELYEEILKEWEVEFVRKNKRDGIVPTSDITVAELKGFVADAETMIKDGMHNTVKRIKVNDQENIKRIKEEKNET